MRHLQPIDVLQSVDLPVKHPFVCLTVLQGPDKACLYFVQVPLRLHVPLLVILDVLHALLYDLSQALEVHVEVPLHRGRNFLDNFFD